MEKIILLEDVEENDLPRIGGKAYSLALMAGHGFNIADALCITTELIRGKSSKKMLSF